MITNYTVLSDELAAQVENLTGSKTVYGMLTPISLANILTSCGAQTAISCIPYALGDNVATTQAMGLAMLQYYLPVWNSLNPNDTNPSTILGWLDFILSGQNTSSQRVDYCGNDISGPEIIPPAQVLDLLDQVQTSVDALSALGDHTTFTFYISNTGPLAPSQITSIQANTNVIQFDSAGVLDTVRATATGITNYTARLIPDALAMDQYVNDQFTYDSLSPYVYRVVWKTVGDTAYIVNYRTQALRMYAQALTACVTQVLYGLNVSTTAIHSSLRQVQFHYNNYLAQLLQPTFVLNNQTRYGNLPATTAVNNAAGNERASLLRTESYIRSFDIDSNNVLSYAERLALENSLSATLIASRSTVGAALADGYFTTLIGYTDTTDQLLQILSVYLNL